MAAAERLRARTAVLLDVGRSPLAPLLAGVLCLTAGIGMVWSVLALYLQSLGAGTSVAGLVIACFGGARLVVNLPAGLVSERWGRRPTLLAGLLLLALGSFGAAGTASIPMLMACLLVQGVGCSAFITTALAAIADLGTPESRMRDMAAFQGASLVGVSIGPGIGGLAAAAWGYGMPFLLQGAMALIAVVPLCRLAMPRNAVPAATSAGSRPGGTSGTAVPLWRLGAEMAGLSVITYGVYYARVAANWVLLPLVARSSLGLSLANIGLMLTASALANLATLPLTNNAAKRFGRGTVIVAANAATAALLLLLAMAHTVALLWSAALLLGAASGLAAPAISAIAADAAPAGRLGAVMGLVRVMTDLGVITGPILTGFVVDGLGFGYPGGLIATALVLAASTSAFFWVPRR
jgi:MFS transporter, DHA1 family, multidrug resistance protein